MKKNLLFSVFAIMVLAQWLVPTKMIWDSESTLAAGTTYKFKTRPIDPSDPFRGKYVTLSYDASVFSTDSSNVFFQNQIVFATITNDTIGFAQILKLDTIAPPHGQYVEAKVSNTYVDSDDQRKVFLKFPFEKFYVEESKAAAAEQAYWRASRDSSQQAYAVIRINDGNAVLQDVIINGKPIAAIVREINQKK